MQNSNRGKQYTFDSFEITKANRKAFDAAKRFAKDADSKPLAIFGGTATGKTHLLYAVKNYIEQYYSEQKIILTTTAEMLGTLKNSIKNGGTAEQFREKYMQEDVLLVDDIQELAGKEATQDELILLFNSFYESGKRIMMTSSQKEVHGDIKERLIIRLFWGEIALITQKYVNAELDHGLEALMRVSIYSREAIQSVIADCKFPKNTAVISFYDPAIKHIDKDYSHVDYSGVCKDVYYCEIDDLDRDYLAEKGYTYETFFPDAKNVAEFIYHAYESGKNVICQCDYGQSRSAGCAAAILEHFYHTGISIFSDYDYYPNQVVYHKIFDALEKFKRYHDNQ